MSQQTSVSHADLNRCLQGLSMPTGPAEVQAVLCGLLCGGAEAAKELWLAEVLPDGLDPANLLHRDCGKGLAGLFDQTRAAFDNTELTFDLLLPEGGSDLTERAAELVDWCRGFNYGLGLSGCSLEGLGDEAREGLADLGEITRLDLDGLEAGEIQEQELTELSEFVRVVVMLIHDDLAPATPRSPA